MGDGFGHGVLRRDLDLFRVAHELQRQLADVVLEGGREQQGLAVLLRQLGQDALDRRQEAHVEHAVGFIQHQQFNAGQVDTATLQVVDQAAGRPPAGPRHGAGCPAGCPCRRRRRCRRWECAGTCCSRAGCHAPGWPVRGSGPGSAHAACAAGTHFLRGGAQVQQRQAERGGLAGTGLCAGQQVATGQRQRDRLLLDRGRVS